jgi:hypothetical protein
MTTPTVRRSTQMFKQRITLAASLPILLSGLPIFGGGRMIYGAMSKYGIQQNPVRMTREFVGYINDPGEFWLGVALILAGALSIVLWVALAADAAEPLSR